VKKVSKFLEGQDPSRLRRIWGRAGQCGSRGLPAK
jgi:hypothetical protein